MVAADTAAKIVGATIVYVFAVLTEPGKNNTSMLSIIKALPLGNVFICVNKGS
jgi:hypothetical protein